MWKFQFLQARNNHWIKSSMQQFSCFKTHRLPGGILQLYHCEPWHYIESKKQNSTKKANDNCRYICCLNCVTFGLWTWGWGENSARITDITLRKHLEVKQSVDLSKCRNLDKRNVRRNVWRTDICQNQRIRKMLMASAFL